MMVEYKGSRVFRNLTGLFLLVALFVSSSMIALAAPGNALSGEIIVSGQNLDGSQPAVTLNGEPALSGRTFFTSGVVATSAASAATINLGKLGRLSLSPNSTLSLTLSENAISGDLSTGQIHVYANQGVSVKIKTPDNGVSSDAGDFTVDLTSGSTVATTESGEVRMDSGDPASSAPKMSNRHKAFWILLPVAAVVTGLIVWGVTKDDDIVSPSR